MALGSIPSPPSVRIIRASSSREEELMYYMLQKTTKMDLLPWFDRKTILAQFDRWQDLKLSDFLVAVDPHDNIVGCLAPLAIPSGPKPDSL